MPRPDVIDLQPTGAARQAPLRASVVGQIHSLGTRNGQYRLTLIGPADDLDALSDIARMSMGSELTITLEEAAE